jgi:hypothetical protein
MPVAQEWVGCARFFVELPGTRVTIACPGREAITVCYPRCFPIAAEASTKRPNLGQFASAIARYAGSLRSRVLHSSTVRWILCSFWLQEVGKPYNTFRRLGEGLPSCEDLYPRPLK